MGERVFLFWGQSLFYCRKNKLVLSVWPCLKRETKQRRPTFGGFLLTFTLWCDCGGERELSIDFGTLSIDTSFCIDQNLFRISSRKAHKWLLRSTSKSGPRTEIGNKKVYVHKLFFSPIWQIYEQSGHKPKKKKFMYINFYFRSLLILIGGYANRWKTRGSD